MTILRGPGLDLPCRACGARAQPLRVLELAGREVQLYECTVCEFVQTEPPDWLDEAYASPINDSDTGILLRNAANARVVLATLSALGDMRGRVVDFAGGYGILVRLLRDYGVDALWSDPYCQNLVARGFDHAGQPATLVTAFEAFEHFVEPQRELDEMLRTAPNVLVSTLLIPKPAPAEWWYYGQEHGQHVGWFRTRTLETMAAKRRKRLVTNGVSYHLFTDRPISSRRWRLLLRTSRLAALLHSRRLSPRTWSDHELAADRAARSSGAD
jgi:hypothetical protein